MELIKNDKRVKCEFGACKNIADYTVKFARVGLKGSVHLCEHCLLELYGLIGEVITPKSIETVKPKSGDASKRKIVIKERK